jgi:hypothetical protein
MSRVVSVHSSIMRFRYFWRPECGAWKDRDCTGLSLSGRDSGNYTSTTHGDYDGKHHAGTVDDRVRNKTKSLGQDLPIFTATYRVLAGADTPASLGGFLLYDEREQFELAQR